MTGEDGRLDSVQLLLERAAAAEGEGQPWRAREILQGSIRSYPTDPRVLEAYGRVLDRLGDRIEAGKYLFLSGVRGSDVEGAIALFVARHGRGDLQNLISQFPGPLRKARLADYPDVVAADLQALGLPRTVRRERTLEETASPSTWRQNLALFGCGVVLLLVLAATLIGFGTIIRWVVGA